MLEDNDILNFIITNHPEYLYLLGEKTVQY